MRFILVAISACLAAGCLTTGEAAAGAWTLAEGSGQLIMTTGRKIAPVGAFMGGPADSDANSSQIYGIMHQRHQAIDRTAATRRIGSRHGNRVPPL